MNWLSQGLTVVASLGFLSACGADLAGNTPLILAAWEGDTARVEALLKKGADVNAANREGTTALMASVWKGKGDVAIVKALLAKGANVNASRAGGTTALILSAGVGNVDFVNLLLQAGADVHAQTSTGTVLHAATRNGHAEIVRALLAQGAKPNVMDAQRQTPLMLACVCLSGGCARAEMVRLLIAAGADVNAKDETGRSALGWVMGGTQTERDQVKDILRAAGAAG